MEVFKCPRCGESGLKETAPGSYLCPTCGATIKDNKIAEILEILKNSPDDFIGNIRYRLNQALKQVPLDYELIISLADKILDKEPTDVFSIFILQFANRKQYRASYEKYLNNLASLEINHYQALEIGKLLIKYYDGYYENLIKNYLENQNLMDDLGDLLNDAIKKATLEITLKNPYLKRDLFIICDPFDFNFTSNLVESLNQSGITTWFEPVNLDYNSGLEEQYLTACKHSKLTLIINSNKFSLNNDLNFLTHKIIDEVKDNELTSHNLTRNINYEIEESNFCNQTLSDVKTINLSEYSGNNFIELIKDLLYKLNHKEDLINSKIFDQAKQARKDNKLKRASKLINELLDSDLTNEMEFKVRLEALRLEKLSNNEFSEKALEHAEALKELETKEALKAYEEELPILIDEHEAFKEGIKYYQEENYCDALNYFTKASLKNSKEALNMLGKMYFSGTGVNEDINKALAYYEKASKLGMADSNRMLGIIYQMGSKIGHKDEFKAFNYFLEGAKLNHPFCSYKVALCYQDGKGTIKDDKKAFEYLKIAAKAGLSDAASLLGKYYKFGKGTEVNFDLAIKCLTYAANNGDFEASKELMELKDN